MKQSNKNSYTALVVEADTTLVDIFQKYGILTSMGYDEEYGRYSNLLQDLAALSQETKELLAKRHTPTSSTV